MIWPRDIRYFRAKEFDSPDEPGSGGLHMKMAIVRPLDRIRARYGRPIKINSGWRSTAWNKKVGGKHNSAHRRGYAVDIACRSSSARGQLVQLAMDEEIHRIGIGKTFVHLDTDPILPQFVMWLYG